jgi:hypothetical protein
MPTPEDIQLAVRVRMYRQGLGDCFLLSFQEGDRAPTSILVDCGVLLGTERPEEVMRGVMEDIRKTTKDRLAVLAATHEHWDHLSGFVQAKELFDHFAVEETWLAWTEDPLHPLARSLKAERHRLAAALAAAAERLGALPSIPAKRSAERIATLLGFFNLGAARRPGTEDGLRAIREKAKTVRYLRPGAEPLRVPGVAGVRVYVLGPPEDEKLLKRSNPTRRGQETYPGESLMPLEDAFACAVESLAGAAPDARYRNYPFDACRRIAPAAAKEQAFFRNHYGFTEEGEWRRIDDDWLASAGSLALKLDNDTNNTSLALAIELERTGKVLLFPGDAQVGNWLSWAQRSWVVRGPDGCDRLVTGTDLLQRTVLYKVGHHGSHNATLRAQGLELMTSPELVAMIPVEVAMARKKRWEMPFPSLLERLMERAAGRVLLADSKSRPIKPPEVTDKEWAKFTGAVTASALSVEYVVTG